MTKEEIKRALAQLYNTKFEEYRQMEMAAQEAARDGDNNGFWAMHKHAMYITYSLDGVLFVVQALGIGMAEFTKEVESDRDEG